MTLNANVQRFSAKTKLSCSTTSCDLPELERDNMRAVKIKLKTDCETSRQRLDDIAHQLEDAIEDWRRFVAANCQGAECSRIFEGLQKRQEALYRDMVEQHIEKTYNEAAAEVAAATSHGQLEAIPESVSQGSRHNVNPPHLERVRNN
jgi:hypothetical protein